MDFARSEHDMTPQDRKTGGDVMPLLTCSRKKEKSSIPNDGGAQIHRFDVLVVNASRAEPVS
jgi:hypothetical protein